MSSRVLTVMFTDIQGFTARTSATSREGLRELLAIHEDLLLPVTAQFGGRLIKTIGDALLVTFTSPTNAVLCGLEMQRILEGWNAQRPESERITIRVALSSGEVEERDNDVFGEAVNVAARLEGIAEAGEVWFTDSVYLAMNKAEVPSSEIGLRRFKGIPESVKVYRAIEDPNGGDSAAPTETLTGGFDEITLPPLDQIPQARSARPKWLWGVVGAAAVVVVAIIVVVSLWEGRPRSDAVESNTPLQQEEAGATSQPAAPAATAPPPPAAPKPAPRPPRDPIMEEVEQLETAVQRALDAGNLDEAFAQAVSLVERHPELESGRVALRAVIGEQIRKYLATKSYEVALKRLDTLEGRWIWLSLDDHRTDIRLAQAGALFDAMKHADAYELLDDLLDKDPHNLRIARAMIERFGATYSHGSRKRAVGAAFMVARQTEGRLEALVGDTLLTSYFSFGPYGDDAASAREILIARHPPAVEAALALVTDRSESRRVNAYRLVRDAGRLSDEQALAHHFLNLATLSSVSKGTLEAAIEWIEDRAAHPGWDELKGRAELSTNLPFRILGDFGERPAQVTALLAQAFMPEITAQVASVATTSTEYRRRCNAYGILRDADALSELDRDAFHAWVLQNFPTKSIHRCYDESIAWFAAAEGDQVGAARAALAAGRVTAAEKLEAYKAAAKPGWNSEFWPERAARNLKLLDDALESLTRP